jgi:hypothetical protein
MSTPHFSQFLHSILQALQEGGGSLTQVEMVDAVDRIMGIPDAVMERRHARYSMVREFDYCLALAQAYLKKVGYLTRSSRGVWVLTAEGKAIDAVDETTGVLEVQ